MSRYIDAEAYIKYCDEHWIALNVDAVNAQPAADVAEVRHGRWNELPYSYECSVCGIIRPKEMTGKWHYCPNCGAKMEVEHENK